MTTPEPPSRYTRIKRDPKSYEMAAGNARKQRIAISEVISKVPLRVPLRLEFRVERNSLEEMFSSAPACIFSEAPLTNPRTPDQNVWTSAKNLHAQTCMFNI